MLLDPHTVSPARAWELPACAILDTWKMMSKLGTNLHTKVFTVWATAGRLTTILLLWTVLFSAVARADGPRKVPPDVNDVATPPAVAGIQYPSVWGYYLPWPSTKNKDAIGQAWKLDDGDIQFLQIVRRPIPPRRGPSRPVTDLALLDFFKGKRTRLSREDLSRRSLDAMWRKRQINASTSQITLSDGTVIKYVSHDFSDRNCVQLFTSTYQSISPEGFVKREVYVLYVLEHPQIVELPRHCFVSGPTAMRKRIEDAYLHLLALNDGTFLAWPDEGNFIVRMDGAFRSSFDGDGRLHVVDSERIDPLLDALPSDSPDARQSAVINALHIKTGR